MLVELELTHLQIAGMKVVEKHNYRGVEAGLRTYNLIIDKNQSTSAQAYVARAFSGDANSIQVGWMVIHIFIFYIVFLIKSLW